MTCTPLEQIPEFDCVVIVTDHSQYDYADIVEKAKLVVDTRNATKGISRRSYRKVLINQHRHCAEGTCYGLALSCIPPVLHRWCDLALRLVLQRPARKCADVHLLELIEKRPVADFEPLGSLQAIPAIRLQYFQNDFSL